MGKQALTENQLELLPFIKKFSFDYYLAGGTALALQIKHRRSIDFDLFTENSLDKEYLNKVIITSQYQKQILRETTDEITLMINKVKITFYHYPFIIPHKQNWKKIINLPSILDLGAMKAYVLGRRAKWKDYIDLYFIFKKHNSLNKICARARKLFGGLFSEKLFREQLCYYKDIDYSEAIEYLSEPVPDREIKDYLTNIGLQAF